MTMLRTDRFVVLAALVLVGAVPRAAVGQAVPTVDANTVVNIDVDDADIVTALKALFKQVNISYVIDPAVKSKHFSAGIHALPFRVALNTLLSNSGTSLDNSFDQGVYRIF